MKNITLQVSEQLADAIKNMDESRKEELVLFPAVIQKTTNTLNLLYQVTQIT